MYSHVRGNWFVVTLVPALLLSGCGEQTAPKQGYAWVREKSGTSAQLNAVAAHSPTLAFAAGASGTLLRWDGTSWQAVPSGQTSNLRTIRIGAGETWVLSD